ncbi:hypothetical protein ACFFRR_009033 [Megaselia abdita]
MKTIILIALSVVGVFGSYSISSITGSVGNILATVDPLKDDSVLKSHFAECMSTFSPDSSPAVCGGILEKHRPTILENLDKILLFANSGKCPGSLNSLVSAIEGSKNLAKTAKDKDDNKNCLAFFFMKEVYTVSGIATCLIERVTDIKAKLQIQCQDLDRSAGLNKLKCDIEELKGLLSELIDRFTTSDSSCEVIPAFCVIDQIAADIKDCLEHEKCVALDLSFGCFYTYTAILEVTLAEATDPITSILSKLFGFGTCSQPNSGLLSGL